MFFTKGLVLLFLNVLKDAECRELLNAKPFKDSVSISNGGMKTTLENHNIVALNWAAQ